MKKLILPLFCALLTPVFSFGQIINTIGGNGTAGYGGDAIPATSSKFDTPAGVAVDAAGNCYVADQLNNRIRKITPAGIVTTIAGTGAIGYTGDGGMATGARLYAPRGIAVDDIGYVYFSDYGNTVVRRISPSGIITTIAGTGFAGAGASGSPATAAALNYPWGIAVDAAYNVYIADQMNNRVVKVSTTGIMTTVAGTMTMGFSGDGGPALSARFNNPTGVAVDGTGNVIIADYANNKVRKINPAGIVSTIAGVGLPAFGYSGDGGPATAAQLYYPTTVNTDAAGNVYICDKTNNCIRKIITASGIITTIAGVDTAGFSGDGGPAIHARLDAATGVAIRNNGDVYIADNNNHRVRRIAHTGDPFFVKGATQNLLFCPTEFFQIDTLLTINDIDAGQTETWSIAQPPAHGTLTVAYSTLSTGGNVTPTGTFYTPALGFTGLDTFKVSIFDGTARDTTTVFVHIVAAPNAGAITGVDSVCPGLTRVLTSSAAGGVWSSSNTSVATISAAGVVSGVTAGTVNITYTVTNECGTATAVFPMRVISSVPCVDAVNPVGNTPATAIHVVPNPSQGTFTVYIPASPGENVTATVTDIAGRQVKQVVIPGNKVASMTLDVPAGIYYIKINTVSGIGVEKIVIEK